MSMEEFNAECGRLNRAFSKPCLTHGTKPDLFLKILDGKELNIPSERTEQTETLGLSFIDRLIGADDAIFFKSGFSYNSKDPKMTRGFIFNIEMIDNSFEIYKIDIMLHLAKEILRYLKINEPEQLSKLTRKDMLKEIEDFFKTDKDSDFDVNGMPCGLFRYYLYIDDLEKMYLNAKCYNKLQRHLLKERKRCTIEFMKKWRLKNEYWKGTVRGAEVICHKSIQIDNSQLIGFYVKDMNAKTLTALKQFEQQAKNIQSPLIIFDGNKTVELNSLNL